MVSHVSSQNAGYRRRLLWDELSSRFAGQNF
jgi:hypothetical protein